MIFIYIYELLKNNAVIKKKVNDNTRKAAKTMWMMDSAKLNDCILWIRPWQHDCQRSVNNCRSYTSGNLKLLCSLLYIIQVSATFIGKMIMIHSLSHIENERQQRVNNVWSCVLGNHNADMLQSVMKQFLAALMGKPDCNTLSVPPRKGASTEHQRLWITRPGKSHLR